MAGVPLKFRCYQCNQLLGVSRAKIGTVVSCPKCSAGLIVPDPDEADPSSPGQGSDLSADLDFGGTNNEEGISLELLDIRPEDIRVEPGVNWTPAVEVPPREPFPYMPQELGSSSLTEPSETEQTTSGLGGGTWISPAESTPKTSPEAVVPPIQLQPTRINEPRAVYPRSRDVVLSRSTVATWSLFVLIAQGLAFVAGLLAGHFLWRVH